MSPQVGRADLIRALSRDAQLQETLAEQLGYDVVDLPDEPAQQRQQVVTSEARATLRFEAHASGDPAAGTTIFQPVDVPFWRVTGFTLLQRDEGPRELVPVSAIEGDPWPTRPVERGLVEHLASAASVMTRLRQHMSLQTRSGRPDVDDAVARLSRGEFLHRLRRQVRRVWGLETVVILDRSSRLAPYFTEQSFVMDALLRVFPEDTVRLATVRDGDRLPRWCESADDSPFQLPAGGQLLALSDLGTLDLVEGSKARPLWQRLGHDARQLRCDAAVLFPAHPAWCPGELSRLWTIIPWEPGRSGAWEPESRDRLVLLLLALGAAAIRFDPALLRRLRRLLPRACHDAGLEALVWQHEDVKSGGPAGARLDDGLRQQLIKTQASQLASLANPQELLDQATFAIRQSHSTMQPAVYFEELLSAPPEALPADLHHERADAVNYLRAFTAGLEGEIEREGLSADAAVWFREIAARLPESVWNDAELADELHHALELVKPRRLPVGADPAKLPGRQRERLAISQTGDSLVLTPANEDRDGSLVAFIESTNQKVKVIPDDRADHGFDIYNDFWADGERPAWATEWGIDQYGIWADLQVTTENGTVGQRLRWIKPGTFLMGSPADEPGRDSDEGPQHEVTISRGFWLFDTACTQALWHAVMSDNPSRFQSDDRPVERVSWDDVQGFFLQVNTHVAAAQFELPTEAEWEYACRAGTTTALYSGDIEFLGSSNAPALDPIAWYGGNSGIDFELDIGEDASWSETQYEFEMAGTHPVGQKRPNDWGLYDVLGNVWEWTSDSGYRVYEADAVTDPRHDSATAFRVVRGGSWIHSARYPRAAYRYADSPGRRSRYIGFRCRVRASEPSQTAAEHAARGGPAERAVSGRSPKAEPGDERERVSGARDPLALPQPAWLDLKAEPSEASLPVAARIRLKSDTAELTLETVNKPAWASAIGRDRFGLWCEFEVPFDTDETISFHPRQRPGIVTQRLRWIPPGQFQFGSPTDEPGRYADYEFEPRTETINAGFWLFDTPVTQALWRAVVGDTPAHFKSPTRPVETVSWDDCQTFNGRLQERLQTTLHDEPGVAAGRAQRAPSSAIQKPLQLELALPTEIEWEYACRAGTDTATYAGPVEYLGDGNAPALDPIAWYSGNCGVDFDLDNGYDMEWIANTQYEFERGGTRPVAEKLPNAWGLYDTIGNVWEWCADAWHRTSQQASRVMRGGSWFDDARYARAACRYAYSPGYRSNSVGFRCRVRELQPDRRGRGAARAQIAAVKAEPGGESGAPSGDERRAERWKWFTNWRRSRR